MAKTILVVDDDKGQVSLMESYLCGKGYTIVAAHDGMEAVDLARSAKPQLILMDVQMPRMDGDEAAMVLKEDAGTKNIPVIFCTALRTDEEIAETREDNIFAKPIHLDQLLAKIRSLIGEP